ncbi:hypothetical protein CEXT_36941 [Caerostris extrusa]|uniref:Uncharacterized protein n=1 Tax=Caerostris extrusa TaxID=172846 RepID=A0AAV4ULX0_CAEEX|nr:hypothetical protein CEXT_36941 [Caerostris extrusa]
MYSILTSPFIYSPNEPFHPETLNPLLHKPFFPHHESVVVVRGCNCSGRNNVSDLRRQLRLLGRTFLFSHSVHNCRDVS